MVIAIMKVVSLTLSLLYGRALITDAIFHKMGKGSEFQLWMGGFSITTFIWLMGWLGQLAQTPV